MSRAVMSAVLVATLSACTSTRYRLDPYDHDAVKARAMSDDAARRCAERRGPDDLPPVPFTSDGCSMWPDGSWWSCCLDHDVVYWCGGSCHDRSDADEALRKCVGRRAPHGMGTLMWLGVRPGGTPYSPFPWRWAYGWKGVKGYDHPRRPAPQP
jgi:hypothetical protein